MSWFLDCRWKSATVWSIQILPDGWIRKIIKIADSTVLNINDTFSDFRTKKKVTPRFATGGGPSYDFYLVRILSCGLHSSNMSELLQKDNILCPTCHRLFKYLKNCRLRVPSEYDVWLLKVVQTQAILFLKSMSEMVGSDIERLWSLNDKSYF